MRALLALGVVGSLLFMRVPYSSQLTVAVEPSALEIRGDTVRVSYRVTSSERSTAELLMFTVDAPSRALRVEIPADRVVDRFAWSSEVLFNSNSDSRRLLSPFVVQGMFGARTRASAPSFRSAHATWHD